MTGLPDPRRAVRSIVSAALVQLITRTEQWTLLCKPALDSSPSSPKMIFASTPSTLLQTPLHWRISSRTLPHDDAIDITAINPLRFSPRLNVIIVHSQRRGRAEILQLQVTD